MLIIKIEFKTGQYHATPWGRNVNEGIPEFPPAPYRLVRAIIDTWMRKRPDWEKERVEPLLRMMASSPPKFALPPATEAFIKSYLSENKKDQTKKQLVYDSFVATNPGDVLMVGWGDVTLDADQTRDLRELLSLINYLGRSESWVEIDLQENHDKINWNSYAINGNADTDNMRDVLVAIPVSGDDYSRTEPEWIDALKQTTEDMFKKKMNVPFALRYATYKVPLNNVRPVSYTARKGNTSNTTTIVYSMESKVPPLITETVKISERVHVKLMGIYRKMFGSVISPRFSGRNSDGSLMTGHKHIFILPLDLNRDGRLDHLMIRCSEPFDSYELKTLEAMHSIWQSDGKPDIGLVPIQWGDDKHVTFIGKTTRFRSETPFVPTRHYRKGRGDYEEWLINEIKHEAVNHGLPVPVSVIRVNKLERIGHSYYWLDFNRNRKGDSTRFGYGFDIVFGEPVSGPFSIGYGAHYGIGIFAPSEDATKNG